LARKAEFLVSLCPTKRRKTKRGEMGVGGVGAIFNIIEKCMVIFILFVPLEQMTNNLIKIGASACTMNSVHIVCNIKERCVES